VLLSPVVALALLFFVAPLGFVVYQSLRDAPLLGPSTFTGLDNYRTLLRDTSFLRSLRFAGLFTLVAAPLIVVAGYALGVLMRARRRLAGLFRALYLVPYVVGLTTLSYMAVLELQPGHGGVNQVLRLLGLTDGSTAWLIRPGTAIAAVTALSAWYSVGLGMLLFMTAMHNVPAELIEAARVDGAGWWTRERAVIFPLVRPTVALVSITTVSGSFLAFTQFFILTQGGPGTSTSTPVIIAYKDALQQFRLGYACALSLVILLLVAGLSVAQFYLFRVSQTER
jgi:multiple sugar transport system permease protein